MNKSKVKKLAKQCAETKEQIDILKETYDESKSELKGIMEDEGIDQFDSDFGKFSISEYPNYEYSDNVNKLKEKLDDLKSKEREDGTAKNNPKVVLKFNKKKNE